jgi:uncharacterized delta-60 repeat protein
LGSAANAIVLQPDGKIVAAGYAYNAVALVRYTTTGGLDPTFGSGGMVTTVIGGWRSGGFAIALQPDGKIVVAGTAGSMQPCGQFSSFALARYTPDGTLDASFGSGGTVTTVIPCTDAVAYGAAIQADGKIVAAGRVASPSTPSVFALARYTPGGSLDASFGSGGMVTTAIGDSNNSAAAIVLQPDGKIVVAGYSSTVSTNPRFALARYTITGSPDASFGSGGTVTTAIGPFSEVLGAALQPDGKIVTAGFAENPTNHEFALARYTAAGSLDASFGIGGTVTTAIGSGYMAEAHAVALQPNGKIVAAGFAQTCVPCGPGITCCRPSLALARYAADGNLDASFGSAGTVITVIGNYAVATAVAVQSNGRIVAAGYDSEETFEQFVVARYLGDICTFAPRLCRTAERSRLFVRNRSGSSKDKLRWKWSKGTPTSQAEFADPTATAEYGLCLYSGSTSALVSESVIPAGASTWSVLGTTGYRYTDPKAAAGGIAKVVLKGSPKHKSWVRVRGKGATLPVLPLPITAPVTVQLVNGANELCWCASFGNSQLLRNDAEELKAQVP